MGNPDSIIVDLSNNMSYDIIMGNRVMGKFKEMTLSSVSRKVLHNSLYQFF